MQKIGVLGSVASLIGLAVALAPLQAPSEEQVNYGAGGQAIGTVQGDVKNFYSQPSRPKNEAEASLPAGFSVDEDGFVRNSSGKRICQTTTTKTPTSGLHGTTGHSYSYATSCKLWDGSWQHVSDAINFRE
jgi:hypothetical protein